MDELLAKARVVFGDEDWSKWTWVVREYGTRKPRRIGFAGRRLICVEVAVRLGIPSVLQRRVSSSTSALDSEDVSDGQSSGTSPRLGHLGAYCGFASSQARQSAVRFQPMMAEGTKTAVPIAPPRIAPPPPI